MEHYKQIEDIFVPEKKEEILENEAGYIAILNEIFKKCLILKKNEEAEAIPFLKVTCGFLEKLLTYNDFHDVLDQFPKFGNHVLTVFFPKLTKIILTTEIFPDLTVLQYTNRFYELMMLLMYKSCKNGNLTLWKTIQSFFNSNKKYFRENKNRCSLEINPYGDKEDSRQEDFKEWKETIKAGSVIDALKKDKRKAKKIWSRAVVESLVKGGVVKIRFLGTNDSMTSHASVIQTPFVINKLGSRATDWDWREGLKVGDKVDAYVYSTIGSKSGWLGFQVMNVVEEEEDSSVFKFVELEQIEVEEDEDDDNSDAEEPYRITFSVHDPNLRKYKRFSDIGDLVYNFPNDDCYDTNPKKYFAILRVEGNRVNSHFKSGYVHSKYYIKMINSFGRNQGFAEMERLLCDPENWCAPSLTGAFCFILAQTGPYLLDNYVKTFGLKFVDAAMHNMLKGPDEMVRDFTKEIIENVHSAVNVIYRRTKHYQESCKVAEHFLLDMAFRCINSDYLERKLHGVTILAEFDSKMYMKDAVSLTKQFIAERIQSENILTGIMKGHPQLITKSLSIFKTLFSLELMTEHELDLLWNGIRKSDVDTKNSIIDILNDIYYDLSNEHTQYFINKMTETESEELLINELELAYNLATFNQTRISVNTEEKSSIANKVVMLLWHVATNDKIKDVDLLKKATKNLKLCIRYCDNITVDETIFDEAIQNISDNKAVLQSMKVIRKLVGLKTEKEETMKYLIEHNIIDKIFSNLHVFKKKIRDAIDAAEDVDRSKLTEEDLVKFMPNQRYNFQKNIMNRMKFIDFMVFESNLSEDTVLEIITKIWDELVMNSLIPIESIFFRNWFVEFSSKITEQLNHKLLSTFFYDKIKYLNDSCKIMSKTELLKTFTEIFIRINLLQDKMEEKVVKMVDEYSSYQTKITEDHCYLIKVSPNELEGIEALWDIIENTDDDNLAKELIEFVTPLYTTPEIDFDNKNKYRAYVLSFIEKCQGFLVQNTSDEEWDKDPIKVRRVNRVLLLLQTIIDYSQSRGLSDIMALSSFFRGDLVELTVVSKFYFYAYFDSVKKFNLKIYGNTTIHELKTLIASKLKRISWKEVKIVRAKNKQEIHEKDNGRTLTDVKYNLGEKFTVISSPVPKVKEEKLMLPNGQINPKGIAVFNQMFDLFADGLEAFLPLQVSKFITVVLEDNFGPDSDRVKKFIQAHDKSGDGTITRDEFMKFYFDSCRCKPGPVLQNIKACGFKEDFTKKESGVEQCLEKQDLAAWHLCRNPQIMDLLFKLLNRQDALSQTTWELLNRLPPASSILRKILNFDGLTDDPESWNDFIENHSPYKAKYYLYILDFLMSEGETGTMADLSPFVNKEMKEGEEFDQCKFKREWRTEFIKKGGFQHLITILMSYVGSGAHGDVHLSLFSFILKIFKSFILASVTIKNPGLYKNIAYIKLLNSAFKYLKNIEKEEIAKKLKDSEPEESTKETEVTEETETAPEEEVETPEIIQIQPPKPIEVKAPIEMTDLTGATTGGLQDGKVYTASAGGSGGLMTVPMVGPHPAQYYNTNAQTKATESSIAKLRRRLKEALVPKEDFIQLRESLQSELGDNPIETIDKVGLIRLLINISSDILCKSHIGLLKVSLVEFSLSISLSLLLADQDFLNQAILTQDLKLLPEDSELKIEGCSDFVSYMMFGLMSKKTVFLRYFNHGFTILMREAYNPAIQKLLLQIVLNNILEDKNTGRKVAKYIEIACPLLEEICSTEKDPKILLHKDDINDIIDLETLFFKILSLLLDDEEIGEEEKTHQSELITGYFMILQRILEIEPSIRDRVAEKDINVVKRVFKECLFDIVDSSEVENDNYTGAKCTNNVTRGAAYQFLVALCKDNIKNKLNLLENGLSRLCGKLPKVASWGYRPVNGKKSILDFVGIYNLQCICYMNAMLQQFYMTPAFRYGIMAANDYQEENIVEEKGRKIDDNVFHQLQRMFAYLDGSERKDFNPKDFCFSFKDYSGNPVNVALQQDTQEFLNRIFDKLDNSLKPTPFKGLMDSVYGGQSCHIMTCSNCGYTRTKSQLFYNLSLEVKNLKSIEEGLEKMTNKDIISDFKCNNCQTKCDVSKACYLNELPNVFIIHLQRLIFDLEVLMNVKINTRYSFPLELNVKPYTLHKYEDDLAEENKEETEEEVQAKKEKLEEYLLDNDNRKEIEEEQQNFIKAVHYEDEYYHYDLSGVVVHRGSAEIGHYYSFINVNRGDPSRPKYTKDKWMEFNDSDIRTFKASNLEEETFGTGNTIEREDEFDYMSMNLAKLEKMNNNKNAYILVYEKRHKKPLKFVFHDDNLKEKDHILENLIKKESAKTAKFTMNESEGEHTLEVDYYSIKKYIPKKVNSEIKENNFQFMMEQHIYSKEFLNFVTGIAEMKEIPDFDPEKLPTRIYTEEEVTPELKEILTKILKMQLSLYEDIISRTSDNQCIKEFTKNMMKIISLCPEASFEIIKDHLFRNIHKIVSLVIFCTDVKVRANTVSLVVHLILVCIKHFKINLSESIIEPEEDETTEEFAQQKGKVIKSFLSTMMIIRNKTTKIYYKKLGPYFKMWSYLAVNNQALAEWFTNDLGLIHIFINFYMSKKGNAYEKNFCAHEKTLNPLLQTVACLIKRIKLNTPDQGLNTLLSTEDNEAFYQVAFFEKIMKENYIFNSYGALREMIKMVCFENIYFSRLFILIGLKNINLYTDTIVAYLEVLKELCLIDDSFSKERRQLILGVPTLMVSVDYHKRMRFGLQCEGNIDKMMYTFYTSLQGKKSRINSLLATMADIRDRLESNCILMIVYLLQIVNSNEECFEHVMSCPSPFAQYHNYYDWIFVLVNEFVKGTNTAATYSNTYSIVQHFSSTLREQILIFEDKIREYLVSNSKEDGAELKHLITIPSAVIYEGQNDEKFIDKPTDVHLGKEIIYSLNNYKIFGACIREENNQDFLISEEDEKEFILRAVELRLNTAENLPNGEGNLSVPQPALYRKMIFVKDIPEKSDFAKFYDVKYKYAHPKKPQFNLTTDSDHEEDDTTKAQANIFKAAAYPRREEFDSGVDSDDGEEEQDDKSEGAEEEEEKKKLEALSVPFIESSEVLKLSLTNVTGSCMACCVRLVPNENCDMFIPISSINFNIKSSKIDEPFLYLIKKRGFGDLGNFNVELIYEEIPEEDFFKVNNLTFHEGVQPYIFAVQKTGADEVNKIEEN